MGESSREATVTRSDEIKKRLEAASQYPTTAREYFYDKTIGVGVYGSITGSGPVADLYSHAPSDLSYLLGELDKARDQLGRCICGGKK